MNKKESTNQEKAIREELDLEDARRVLHELRVRIIDYVGDLIYIKDRDSVYQACNAASEKFIGLTESEQIGKTDYDFFGSDFADAIKEKDRQIFATGIEQRFEEWVTYPDGKRVLLDTLKAPLYGPDGNIAGLVGISRDITERHKVETALRESEERFRTLAEATFEGIAITEHGRILDVNERLTKILGLERNELLGREVADLIPPEERDRVMSNILLGVESHIEHELLCKDGSRRIVEAHGKTIDQRNRQLRITAIHDITERKRAEEEIETLNTELAAHAEELEAVNKELEAFNYTVAHDLCIPLSIISGSCQLILELCGDRLDEECKKYLQVAYDGTLRMNQLIGTLLKFSRLIHVELCRESIDLSYMAAKVAAELKQSEPARRVTFRIADGISANGDASLLRVVLENLLGNAWKYTSMKEEAIIEFDMTEINRQPVWFVRDNGSGFDMADIDYLFAPFQRLPGSDELIKGHGIGLATVERIIRRHGGRVWAEGEPGKGATFYFTL